MENHFYLHQAKHWLSSYGQPHPGEESLARISSNPPQPWEEDPVAYIESQVPNLPLSYWQDNANGKGMALNGSCAKMPNLLNLRYNNLYWQEVVTSNITLYLYGAYLDIRARNRGRLRWTLSAFLSTQKSAQKSKTTQKSALESKSALLSAQKSAQTSGFAQKRAQMSSFTQKRAQLSGPLKKVLKRGDTQKSKTLKIVCHSKEGSKKC